MSTTSDTRAPEVRSGGAKIVGDLHSDHAGPGPHVMGASTLKGDSVFNPAGADLGHVEDIMLDVGRGKVAYAVLSFGGFLGMGNKLFAVPWQALGRHGLPRAAILRDGHRLQLRGYRARLPVPDVVEVQEFERQRRPRTAVHPEVDVAGGAIGRRVATRRPANPPRASCRGSRRRA